MSTTGSAFRRWHVLPEDLVVLAPDGFIIEQAGGLGASGAPIHLAVYELFDGCGAIIHSHTAYSHEFAALGRPVPDCREGDVNRVESAAHTAIHLATLLGGLNRLSTNPLYPDHGRINE